MKIKHETQEKTDYKEYALWLIGLPTIMTIFFFIMDSIGYRFGLKVIPLEWYTFTFIVFLIIALIILWGNTPKKKVVIHKIEEQRK